MSKKSKFANKNQSTKITEQVLKEELSFFRKLNDNIQVFQQLFGNSNDLIFRRLEEEGNLRAIIIYFEGLVNKQIIDEFVIKEIYQQLKTYAADALEMPLKADKLELNTSNIQLISTFSDAVNHLVNGNTVVLLEGHSDGLAAETQGGQRRSLDETPAETVIRGPRESFIEALETNIALIRWRIRSHKLRVEKLTVGKLTNTPVSILYLEGVAQKGIVEEVKGRISRIHIDGILESLYIEEFIEDPQGYTPFPTVFSTERPDRISAGLLEGRVAIITEGTPFALLVPSTFSMFLYSNEDYYHRFDISSFTKILRLVSFFISLVTPGLYVALLSFHHEMIPTTLLIALVGQREGVPFTIFVELMLMELTFEILREAGIRLPKTIGAAVSIVGALVLGQAAVEAGLVAQGTIIVVAITAIASFTTASYSLASAARLLRFFLLILSASFGAFGLITGLLFILVHLNSLRSFSVPYLAPVAPFHSSGWRDVFIRVPWRMMKVRPEEIAGRDNLRMAQQHKPNMRDKRKDES